MSKILLYTFNVPSQITYKLVDQIEGDFTKYYLGSLKELQKIVLENKFDYIIGLGNYGRRNTKSIRIENTFINTYGKKKINPESKDSYFSTWNLKEENGVVISNIPTIGPCNRSAYVLLDLIERNALHAKLAFIHVPKNSSIIFAKELLSRWLTSDS